MARDPGSTHGTATRWAGASFLLALVASLVLLFAPLGTEGEESARLPSGSSGQIGPSDIRVTHRSLVDEQGWSVAAPLSVPVVLTGIGVVAARRRWQPAVTTVANLLGVGIVLGAASIGLYYLPTEAAMIVAAVKVPGP